MINPFFMSVLCSIIILLFLSLGWTDLFFLPDSSVFIFLGLMAFINIILSTGVYLTKSRKVDVAESKLKLGFILLLLYLINFLFSGEVALINVITNTGSYYKDIRNIPTLFPLIVSLNVYLIIRTFYRYCVKSSGKELAYFILLLIPLLLIMGRGILVIALLTCLILYLRIKDVFSNRKTVIYSVIFIITIGFGFSMLGQVRSASNEVLNEGNAQLTRSFTELSKANESFFELGLPESLLWVYVYAVSPLSNFNNAVVTEYKNESCELITLSRSFLPESVQKNFMPAFESLRDGLVSPIFNVSTMFLLPYYYCGWYGVFCMLLVLYLMFFMGFFVVRNTPYCDTYMSLMSTVFILGFFSNVLILDVVFIPIALMICRACMKKLNVVIRR